MTDDILAAIDARLADLAVDEALALAAGGESWEVHETINAEAFVVGPRGYPFGLVAEPSRSPEDYGRGLADHIAHHDPATVLERVRRERACCLRDKKRLESAESLRRDHEGYGMSSVDVVNLAEHVLSDLRADYLDGDS